MVHYGKNNAERRHGCAQLLENCLGARCYIPKEVKAEVREGISVYPILKSHLEEVLNAEWLRELVIEDLEDLRLFARLKLRWGKADRNDGEAAALVLARRHNLIAVIDDPVGRKAAQRYGIECIGTVGLLASFVVAGFIDVEEAWVIHEQMIELADRPYRSPVKNKSDFDKLVGNTADL